MIQRKKLIEVSLPLDAINKASAREKSIRHGHPSTLHLWWARRPLAAARAVIFAQMVDDPSTYIDELKSDTKIKRKAETRLKARLKTWQEAQSLYERAQGTTANVPEPGPKPGLNEALADIERERLFSIIEEIVTWENTTNEDVLQKARDEIWQSWRRTCAENADHPQAEEIFDRNQLPEFHDPFAGGGALPLEAQRLGLESYASDLNPVAVLINKAMIEIPPKFAGQPPVNPKSKTNLANSGSWNGATGLAEDVRYYGNWIQDEAKKRIGKLYPKIEISDETISIRPDLEAYRGEELTVIAWVWCRTVKSPNPAFSDVQVPLVSTFNLSTKKGKEAYIAPYVDNREYGFVVKSGKPKDSSSAKNGTKLGRASFGCLMSGTPIPGDYIKAEAKSGRMGVRLMAIVAEGKRGRVYLSPDKNHELIASKAKPEWGPEVNISGSTQYIGVKPYGIDQFDQLFTQRQLVALNTYSELVTEVIQSIVSQAKKTNLKDDNKSLSDNGRGVLAYAEAIGVYLAFAVDKGANYWSTVCAWHQTRDGIVSTFGRQALPMIWDFAEANPISNSSGNYLLGVEQAVKMINALGYWNNGYVYQSDAATQSISSNKVVSTDPPYYDNIPYADLSDFFYVWLRRSLRKIYPDLFTTMGVPKGEELVAFAYRHENGKAGAEAFFLDGMSKAMHQVVKQSHPAFPVTIYYAFRQAENQNEGVASTGWETFLDAVIRAGFSISGTWPVRTEYTGNLKSKRNALASSIVLVCSPRPHDAPQVSRREFLNTLKNTLPEALTKLQGSSIAPVDLAQAAIGPGMAVYTHFGKLSVRTALALINQVLDEVLAEQEGDFDADSRWALTWFEDNGFIEGEYGKAEQLSKSKNTGVDGLVEAGIITSGKGKVRLLKPSELSEDWDPMTDKRLTVWEMVHHLIRVLENDGESSAAELVAKLGSKAESARELCYRLYSICERKSRASEAMAYNALVQSWPEINRLAQDASSNTPSTADLFE